MKISDSIFLITISLAGWAATFAEARTWTDAAGRTVEADLVRVDGGNAVLKMDGKEVPVPLTRLSGQDKRFVDDWKKSQPAGGPVTPAAGPANPGTAPATGAAGGSGLTVCGVPMKLGGSVNIVEEPLSPSAVRGFAKAAPKPTTLKIGIALPANFDPEKPQHVMWVSAAINSEGERKHGNIGALGHYVKTAIAAGWLVVAADTELGNPRLEDNQNSAGGDLAVHQQAVEALAKAWPKFKTWEFACCGFSGGAKATFYRVGDLIASHLNVIGMFLAGCNQNMTAAACQETRCPIGKLHKVNVYIINGQKDDVSTVAHAQTVERGLKGAYGKVKLVLFDAGHNMNQAEFGKAIAWFAGGDTKNASK